MTNIYIDGSKATKFPFFRSLQPFLQWSDNSHISCTKCAKLSTQSDLSVTDGWGQNIMDIAMEISGVDTVSKILDAGLDYFLEYRDYFGYSYLHNIAYFGRHELAPYFIEAGFDPKEKDPMEGKTPFQIAKMMAGDDWTKELKKELKQIYS